MNKLILTVSYFFIFYFLALGIIYSDNMITIPAIAFLIILSALEYYQLKKQ